MLISVNSVDGLANYYRLVCCLVFLIVDVVFNLWLVCVLASVWVLWCVLICKLVWSALGWLFLLGYAFG